LPIAFFRLQSAGASQIHQRHGCERGERKGASTLALVIPSSAGRDGYDVGKIAGHPRPDPGLRTVTSQKAKPAAISRAP
jgi:hypothetical protein